MVKYSKIHHTLSVCLSLIPLSLVLGAAVLELFIILSCFLFFFLNYKKIALEYYKNKFFLIFSLFYFFLVTSSILSEHIMHSLKNTFFYFRFGIITLSVWYLLENFKKFKLIFFYLTLITFIILIFYSFIEIFILKNYSDPYRISGIFGSESIQGSFLLRVTPILMILYFYNRESIKQVYHNFFYLILIFILILILLSGERAAIFLMIVFLLLSLLFLKIRFTKILVLTTLFISIFLATLWLYPKAYERIVLKTYNEFFDKNLHTQKIYLFSKGHEQHALSALKMFKNNYIKGVGVRNFRMECQKEDYLKLGEYYCTTHPHNTYMQLLSETGLVGFLFFVFFLFFIFCESLKYLNKIYLKNEKLNIPLGIIFSIILTNFFPLASTGSFFNNWLSAIYFLPLPFLLYEIKYFK